MKHNASMLTLFIETLVIGAILSVVAVPSKPEERSPLETFRKDFLPSETKGKKFVSAEEFQSKIAHQWQSHTVKADTNETFIIFDEDKVYGKTMMTINGREIFAFQGFRYGEPITNITRFKPPIQTDKTWKDGEEFYATHIGLKCPQGAMIGGGPSGDEDCLVLNVYVPYLPTYEEDEELLPVMFFIHGGAFTSGDSSMYLPTKLLDRDIILVTIHYRLGAHGFFTLNNDEAPGNAALYDMVAALNWTNRNIQYFGGDKDRVTIFGESAGSVSVNYMMLVEPARGLFSAVIAESGSCLDVWAIDEDPSYAAHYLANEVGCLDENDEVIFECMANVNSYDLLAAERSLVSSDRHHGEMGFRGAAPTIQNFESEDESFQYIVTKHPRDYLTQRDFSKVPFMTGANKQEGSFVLAIMYNSYLLPNNLQNNQTFLRLQMIPVVLNAVGITDDSRSIAKSLQDEYCPGLDLGFLTDEVYACMIDMVGVMFLKAGSWQTSAMHSLFSDGQPSWYYSFELSSDDSMASIIIGSVPFDTGVTHSDELMYIFSMPAVMDFEGQRETMDKMVELWTNFAIYHDPTPAARMSQLEDLGIPQWPENKYDDPHYLIIDKELVVKTEYSDRWRITLEESTEETNVDDEKCEGVCQDYKDQRDNYEITMIVFIVSCFFVTIIAAYFFFKARR